MRLLADLATRGTWWWMFPGWQPNWLSMLLHRIGYRLAAFGGGEGGRGMRQRSRKVRVAMEFWSTEEDLEVLRERIVRQASLHVGDHIRVTEGHLPTRRQRFATLPDYWRWLLKGGLRD